VSAIEEIKAKLANYPSVRYTESPSSIEVQPQDESGFAVSLHLDNGGFAVHFEGWHERFDSKDEALNCFAFGLSPSCRLTIIYRGSTPTKWIVESLENGSWVEDSEVGLIFFPFWRARRRVHKKNGLLPARRPTRACS
jgi:hypothetical protein